MYSSMYSSKGSEYFHHPFSFHKNKGIQSSSLALSTVGYLYLSLTMWWRIYLPNHVSSSMTKQTGLNSLLFLTQKAFPLDTEVRGWFCVCYWWSVIVWCYGNTKCTLYKKRCLAENAFHPWQIHESIYSYKLRLNTIQRVSDSEAEGREWERKKKSCDNIKERWVGEKQWAREWR